MAANYFQVELERLEQRSKVLMSDFYNLDSWGLHEWQVRDPALILAKRDQFQAELNKRLAPFFEARPAAADINAGYLRRARDVVHREHGALLELAQMFDGVAREMGPKVREIVRPQVTVLKRKCVLTKQKTSMRASQQAIIHQLSEISTGQPSKGCRPVSLFGLLVARSPQPRTSRGQNHLRGSLGYEGRT